MRDPPPAAMQNGSVTAPADKGMLSCTDLPEATGVEAQRHILQDKGISGTAFRISLFASCDTTEAVYYGSWESFVSLCDGKGQNPIRISLKHVLDIYSSIAKGWL